MYVPEYQNTQLHEINTREHKRADKHQCNHSGEPQKATITKGR